MIRRVPALGFMTLLALGCGPSQPPLGLNVGLTAPDFSAKDLAGNEIKLSNYRGKIVIVDFWATWCGPCVAMIPHEKEMMKRFADRPVVMIGISADREEDKLREFVKMRDITWPNVFDGQSGGSLARIYQIEAFPTIFVIDSRGVIRHRFVGVPGPELDGAIVRLLDEM
jgi:peroxiredoxin